MTKFIWLVEAFGLALTLVLLVTPLVIRSAGALKLYDAPDGGRKNHETPVPRLGGVAVWLSAAAVVCVLFSHTSPLFVTPGPTGDAQIRVLAGALIGSGLLFLTGLVDDVRGLTPAVKGIAQVVAAGIAYLFGANLPAVALGYGVGVPLGVLEAPLVLLWIVAVTNAFNFIDGLNGLAGGIAVVACATIFVAGLALGNFSVLMPAAALAGALIGFLRFNFPRARIFLGDSGSMSIGFLLAVLSLDAASNSAGAVLVIIPLLAVFVPLMDGALAIVRRWLRHVPVSGADARHIHHRLLALGIGARRTALILWALAGGMAGFGLLMALTAPFVATSIAIFGLVAVSVLLIYGTNLLSYHEFMVAGEVLLSAPSRARRVITDQILALDLAALLEAARTPDEVAAILSKAAAQFGFMAMELRGDNINASTAIDDRVNSDDWAWRLDYPVRLSKEEKAPAYVLSIWCSAEVSTRPYGAERIARILGPALHRWFDDRAPRDGREVILKVRGNTRLRRLRVIP